MTDFPPIPPKPRMPMPGEDFPYVVHYLTNKKTGQMWTPDYDKMEWVEAGYATIEIMRGIQGLSDDTSRPTETP